MYSLSKSETEINILKLRFRLEYFLWKKCDEK